MPGLSKDIQRLVIVDGDFDLPTGICVGTYR